MQSMAPSPTTADASRRSDKRQAILDAALELFVERGFHGTAMPALAQRAHVGAGTIYRYFENKEALGNALYQEWKQRFLTHMLAGLSPDGPAREQFGRLWRRIGDFFTRHPTAYSFLELHHHASYLDDDSRAMEDSAFALAIGFIEAAQQRGEFRQGPPDVLWSLVQGAFIGLARSVQEGRLALGPAALEAAEAACWQLVAPEV